MSDLYRVQLVFPKPPSDRITPKALILVRGDERLELPGVLTAVVNWSSDQPRTLTLQMHVAGFDEVWE